MARALMEDSANVEKLVNGENFKLAYCSKQMNCTSQLQIL